MAEALEKKFPNGAKLIFLDGEPGSGSAVLRAKGFFDAIEKEKDKYEIVARQTAKWQRPEGLRVTQNILTAHHCSRSQYRPSAQKRVRRSHANA